MVPLGGSDRLSHLEHRVRTHDLGLAEIELDFVREHSRPFATCKPTANAPGSRCHLSSTIVRSCWELIVADAHFGSSSKLPLDREPVASGSRRNFCNSASASETDSAMTQPRLAARTNRLPACLGFGGRPVAEPAAAGWLRGRQQLDRPAFSLGQLRGQPADKGVFVHLEPGADILNQPLGTRSCARLAVGQQRRTSPSEWSVDIPRSPLPT